MGKNSASIENGKKSQFTSNRQPRKRGRLNGIFGPLAKENNLSLDDVRKIYKNILTAKTFGDLDTIKAKYPSVLTDMTVEMLKQDKRGRSIGKQTVVVNEEGETIKVIGERIKSYETIQYMLERIYGTPSKTDITILNQTDIE